MCCILSIIEATVLRMIKMNTIPDDHPRAKSLKTRHLLVDGMIENVVTPSGLIAHGRGEAFDYLIGEITTEFAKKAIEAAVAKILVSKHPVLSVNGNVAALVAKDIVKFSKITGALIEINIFYRTEGRIEAIERALRNAGAEEIYGTNKEFWTEIPELKSFRRIVDKRGIYIADTVFVPLEDGDRTEALRKLGKTVIAVDLNPLSRTAKAANITIVDNITRCMPLMVEYALKLKHTKNKRSLINILNSYNNEMNLRNILLYIRNRLEDLSKEPLLSF